MTKFTSTRQATGKEFGSPKHEDSELQWTWHESHAAGATELIVVWREEPIIRGPFHVANRLNPRVAGGPIGKE